MKPELPIIIGHVEKNATQRIRVALDTFKGRAFLDIRVQTQTRFGEKLTTKGVTIHLDRVRDFRRLIDSALEQIERPNEAEPEI